MFCKWCGADIPNSAARCKRCGKDNPALSNCGGFYDLVPDAKRNPVNPSRAQQTAPKQEAAAPETQSGKYEKRNEPAKGRKNKGHKTMGLLMGIMCVCFVLVFVFLFVLSSKISDNTDGIEQLGNDIKPILSDIDAIKDSLTAEKESEPTVPSEETNPDVTEPTETEPTVPDPEEQEISISFDVCEENGERNKVGEVEQGEFQDTITYAFIFDGDVLEEAGFALDEDECITADIKQEESYTEEYTRLGTVSVEFDVDDAVFGAQDGEAECEWKWRYIGDYDWNELDELDYYDEEVFTEPDTEFDAELNYEIDELEQLKNENGTIELQLVYTRENVLGHSITIMISGIELE